MSSVDTIHARALRRFIVDDETGCWEWQGSLAAQGYGYVFYYDETGRKTGRPAHRVVYEAQVGSIPEGSQLDHLCRNRACVNPAHLEPVTNAENCRRGSKAKLTAEQARAIRDDTRLQREIAADYGIHAVTVSQIKTGKRWATA